MTFEERRRYISIIKTASTDPEYKEDYDTLIDAHRILFNTGLFTNMNAGLISMGNRMGPSKIKD